MRARFDGDADFAQVEAFLQAHSGMHFGAGLRERALRAVRHTADRFGCASTGELLELIASDASALDGLLDELTVGETYFFREPEQFEAIRGIALPDILERRGAGHVVRGWSAGCASGEEAYSLAMVLAEEGLSERASVLGTDLSSAKLARARAGVYRAWSLRGTGAHAADPYLVPAGEQRRVVDRIRRLVSFRRLNLVADAVPSLETGTWEMDLILCRNVMIYFDRATIELVAARLYEALAPGGWLFTAGSDPVLTDFAPFVPVAESYGPAYRRLVRDETSATVSTPALVRAPAPKPPDRPIQARTPQPPRARPELALESETGLEAFSRGDYARAAEIASRFPHDAAACALRVRALANLNGSTIAFDAVRAASERHPLSTELQYLRASLLVDLGRDAEAVDVFRQVLYLDRTLAVAHFSLATVLGRLGDDPGARRGFRNAIDACRHLAADEPLPLGEGTLAGALADAARANLKRLDAAEPAP
jgi:chemotaxis protein methyltransferase CheR